jgi:hypothetical protein
VVQPQESKQQQFRSGRTAENGNCGTLSECEPFKIEVLWFAPQANFRGAFGTKNKSLFNK